MAAVARPSIKVLMNTRHSVGMHCLIIEKVPIYPVVHNGLPCRLHPALPERRVPISTGRPNQANETPQRVTRLL
jgi:hypothetical protein